MSDQNLRLKSPDDAFRSPCWFSVSLLHSATSSNDDPPRLISKNLSQFDAAPNISGEFMKRWLFLCLIVLFVSPSALSQDVSLFIGGMNVKLGMLQETVMNKLRERNELQQIKDSPGVYIIRDRNNSDRSTNVIGSVSFLNNKVIGASKEWLDTSSAARFTDTLYGILEQMEGRGEMNPTIAIKTTREPSLTFQQIHLCYRKRSFNILTVSDSRYSEKQVSITEEISDTSPCR